MHEKWCRQDFSYKKNKKNKNKIVYTMLWKLKINRKIKKIENTMCSKIKILKN